MLYGCVDRPRTEATKGWDNIVLTIDRGTVQCNEKVLERDTDAYTKL